MKRKEVWLEAHWDVREDGLERFIDEWFVPCLVEDYVLTRCKQGKPESSDPEHNPPPPDSPESS